MHGSPQKWETFFQKIILMGEQILWEKSLGGLFYMGTNDQIIPTKGGGISQNAFSGNLKTLNLKNLTNHCGIFT